MTTMDIWKTFEPDTYYKSFLEKNKRPDGRGLMSVRPITVKVGTITTADGSSTVRVGHTTVICGIKAEIATPVLRNPNQGFIVPNVELYPCCSHMFKIGPPGEKAMATSQFLKNVISSAKVLDLTDLCIVHNKLMDPTAEDETQGSGEVTVVLLENGSLCTTHKPGGQLILPNILDTFVDLAKQRVHAVNTLIGKEINE
nr:exosome complex component RRP43-like [Cherax quadricarinatus]